MVATPDYSRSLDKDRAADLVRRGQNGLVDTSVASGLQTRIECSFRHGFKDALRAARVSEDVNDALTGHAGGNSVARSYGAKDMVRRFGLLALEDAVSKVAYPGLDLSRIDRG
jgi:hypothetical protein